MKKLLRIVIKLLKGCLIGISIVVPGVSGGSMAMSMGIYDQLLSFTTAHRRASFENGRTLIPYGIGALLGIILFSYFIELSLSAYPLQTAGAFVGLILGVLPLLQSRVRGHRMRLPHVLLILFMIGLLIAMPILSATPSGAAYVLTPTFPHAALALLLGFLSASTMVIPGLSGSMLLLLLGCFDTMLQHVNGFMHDLFLLDIPGLLSHAAILFPFTIGTLLGIVLTSRLIKTLLHRYPLRTYYAIIGLVIGSPFAVIYPLNLSGMTLPVGIASLICVLVGFAVAALSGRGEEAQ